MARLVIVSNRVAMPRDTPSRAGGLAVALRDAMADRGERTERERVKTEARKAAAHADAAAADPRQQRLADDPFQDQ